MGPAAVAVGDFKFSTDPELDAKIRDVVGLYMDPPEKAVVLPGFRSSWAA